MVDLDEQLRNYSTWLAEQADHRAAERAITGTVEVEPIEPGRRVSRRWLLGAAASIVLLIGVVALLALRDDETGTIDDAPAPTTPASVAPTTVAEASTSTSAPPPALRPGEPVVVDPDVIVSSPRVKTVLPWDEGFLVVTNVAATDDFEAPTPYRAVYTTDGSPLTETDFELPVPRVIDGREWSADVWFQVADERVVAWQFSDWLPEGGRTLTIATTRDVVNWDTARYDLYVEVDDPALDATIATAYDYISDMVIRGDRWYAQARQVRWELGADGVPRSEYGVEQVLLAGDFAGNYEALALPEKEGGKMGPLGDGLAFFGSTAYTSADGREWTEIGRPSTRGPWYVAEAGENLLVYSSDGVVRLGPDGQFVPTNPPEQLAELANPEANGKGDPALSHTTSPAWITGPRTGAERWMQDLWLIATEDGVEWFTLDVPNKTETSAEGLTGAVVNDGLVFYRTREGYRIVRMT